MASGHLGLYSVRCKPLEVQVPCRSRDDTKRIHSRGAITLLKSLKTSMMSRDRHLGSARRATFQHRFGSVLLVSRLVLTKSVMHLRSNRLSRWPVISAETSTDGSITTIGKSSGKTGRSLGAGFLSSLDWLLSKFYGRREPLGAPSSPASSRRIDDPWWLDAILDRLNAIERRLEYIETFLRKYQ